jgi:hypothetical protein
MTNSVNGVNRSYIIDADGHAMNIYPDGSVPITNVPEGAKFYFHTIYDVPGVVASNNFLSVFNPGSSTKAVIFYAAEIASYAVGATSVATSITAARITAASGGTLITAANTNRFVTSDPNPQAEVRVGNPTVTTVGLPLNGWIPPIATGAGSGATAYTSVPPGAGFFCVPGQGIVFNTAAGNVNQMWKINTIWAEI